LPIWTSSYYIVAISKSSYHIVTIWESPYHMGYIAIYSFIAILLATLVVAKEGQRKRRKGAVEGAARRAITQEHVR
jgi:hypothetical protein